MSLTIVFGLVEERKDNGLNDGLILEVSLLIHPLLWHLLLQMQLSFLLWTTMCSEWAWCSELCFFFIIFLHYWLPYWLLDWGGVLKRQSRSLIPLLLFFFLIYFLYLLTTRLRGSVGKGKSHSHIHHMSHNWFVLPWRPPKQLFLHLRLGHDQWYSRYSAHALNLLPHHLSNHPHTLIESVKPTSTSSCI